MNGGRGEPSTVGSDHPITTASLPTSTNRSSAAALSAAALAHELIARTRRPGLGDFALGAKPKGGCNAPYLGNLALEEVVDRLFCGSKR